jgi:CRP/FNR family transcriptional regulator, cyclic AMP receptor protein
MSVTAPETREQIRALLASHCFIQGMRADYVDRIVAHAGVRTYPEGTRLFSEGGPADEFHLVIEGRVALEMFIPGRGTQVLDSVDACETAGWSWLVPPYRWFFDARAVTDVRAVTVDAAALRDLCEADPAFGYDLLQRTTRVMLERMQAARVRLADLYGGQAP